ncbi:MAG: molybdopterin cofactor-binding domain-containing protein [Pseudomonadota bacterium]
MKIGKIARRTFMGLGLAATGGLAVGYYFYRRPFDNPLEGKLAEGERDFTPYVIVNSDNGVTIIAPRAEMGQGVHTTLAALVAEELDVSLAAVKVEHGPPGYAYFNQAMMTMSGPVPWFDESAMAAGVRGTMRVLSKFLGLQVTGGSSSIVDGFEKMRLAGATAREAFKEAAAKRWNLPVSALATKNGQVLRPDGTALRYGDLVIEAAAAALPAPPALRDPREWTILGKPQTRVDAREKATGARIFGIDIELPDMLHASLKMAPRLGAAPLTVDQGPALAVRGVRKVVPIDCSFGHGFAVIADSTWAAFKGVEALDVAWGAAPYPADDAAMETVFRDALAAAPVMALGGAGDAETALAAAPAARVIEAEYEVPFLAHATMEPMNATAHLKEGKLEVWVGTQAPGLDAILCARALDLETADVTVHVTRLGGGFGRRALDAAVFAALTARHSEGRPVKLTWTREEDMRHDFYRPRAIAKMQAVVAPGKPPEAYATHVAAPGIVANMLKRSFSELPAPAQDDSLLDGQFNQPIATPHRLFAGHVVDIDLPLGFWRSVGNSVNGFFMNGFLDEVAEKSGMDPIEMRLGMMTAAAHAPARAVLETLRDVCGWGAALPPGHGRGVAFTLSFGSWVGEVVEVDASKTDIRMVKIWCVADAGRILDPGIFTDQMTSGIVYGLSAALGQEITFSDGMVQQGNFDSFDAMRMWQCPPIDVHLLETAAKMGGAGEPGTPPAAPALANAIYAATGKRLRRMPFTREVRFA